MDGQAAFLDDVARAEIDPRWLHSKKWHGVISRHTTPALVQACVASGVNITYKILYNSAVAMTAPVSASSATVRSEGGAVPGVELASWLDGRPVYVTIQAEVAFVRAPFETATTNATGSVT